MQEDNKNVSDGATSSSSDNDAAPFDRRPSKNRDETSANYFDVTSTLKKQYSTIEAASDDTAEVSESDSDFGSEHSYSITPYPSSDDFIPTNDENKRDQHHASNEFYCEHEPVGLRLVTPHSSSNHMNDAEDSMVDNVVQAKKQSTTTRMWYLFAISLLVSFFGYRSIAYNTYNVTSSRDTIYVPGAGFSGFWYTLGRLQSIEEPENNDYYCFSAGCLGVLASLRNFTLDETLDIALNIQSRWKSGEIKRHDVVGEFVDTLVNTTSSTKSNLLSLEESSVLERMHVITSVKENWFGMKTHIRSPRTSEELREMLLQTTWIPFAVGHSLWHKDSTTGMSHMDGGFTMPFHPKTTHFLGLPLSAEILLNVVNVNIGLEKVKQFWKAGMARGV